MIAVKVKLKGRDAAHYLGQLSVPGSDSPAPRVKLESPQATSKKKRMVVIRKHGRRG